MSSQHQMHGALSFPTDVDPTRPLNYKYEAIIDYLIAFPMKDKGEIAEELGFTGPWLSTLTSSDAFVARYSFRREQYTAELEGKVKSQVFEMAQRAAEVVIAKLQEEDCDPQYALEASTRALRSLGFGAKPSGTPSVGVMNVQNNVIQRERAEDRETLDAARQRLADVSRLSSDIVVPITQE